MTDETAEPVLDIMTDEYFHELTNALHTIYDERTPLRVCIVGRWANGVWETVFPRNSDLHLHLERVNSPHDAHVVIETDHYLWYLFPHEIKLGEVTTIQDWFTSDWWAHGVPPFRNRKATIDDIVSYFVSFVKYEIEPTLTKAAHKFLESVPTYPGERVRVQFTTPAQLYRHMIVELLHEKDVLIPTIMDIKQARDDLFKHRRISGFQDHLSWNEWVQIEDSIIQSGTILSDPDSSFRISWP